MCPPRNPVWGRGRGGDVASYWLSPRHPAWHGPRLGPPSCWRECLGVPAWLVSHPPGSTSFSGSEASPGPRLHPGFLSWSVFTQATLCLQVWGSQLTPSLSRAGHDLEEPLSLAEPGLPSGRRKQNPEKWWHEIPIAAAPQPCSSWGAGEERGLLRLVRSTFGDYR